jgi:DNA-binding SARP family transcriptional activator
MYEIQLFGPLEVRTRGVRLSGADLGGDAPRHILALLALRGKVRKAELAELVWQGRPPTGHPATLEGQLSLLRHRLDPGGSVRNSIITASNDGYALVADRVRVDVARFDELVTAASHRAARGALRPLTAAAHLAARPLLEDVTTPGWAAQARERYRARLLRILLDGGELALATGDFRTALEMARRALGIDPGAARGHAVVRAAGDAHHQVPVFAA